MKPLPRVIGCPSSLGCSGQISRQPHLARLLSGLFGRLAGRPGGPSPEGLLDLYAELLGRQAIRFMGDLRILFGYDVPRYPTLTMVVLFFLLPALAHLDYLIPRERDGHVQRAGGCRGQQQRAQDGHGDEQVAHQRVRTRDVGVHISGCGGHVHRRLMSKMPGCIGDSPMTRRLAVDQVRHIRVRRVCHVVHEPSSGAGSSGTWPLMEYKGLPTVGRRLLRERHDVEYPKTNIINN